MTTDPQQGFSTRERVIIFAVAVLGIVVLVAKGFYWGWVTRGSMP